MACPSCGCKVHYQYDDGDDCGPHTEGLERCAACGAIFDIEDAADDEDDAYGVRGTSPTDIAAAIHYPDCWDTAAYPTLASALNEMAAAFLCTNDDCTIGVKGPGHG